jgi:SAM-dependent methyltransferase
MDLLQLVDLLELADTDQKTSYATPLKLITAGRLLGLDEDTYVIDFGCAEAKALSLWARYFGSSGIGVELSERFCAEARARIAAEGMADKIEIVQHDASTYAFQPGGYDVACCIGASMIWGGFRPTLQALKCAVKPGGPIVIGEPYYAPRELPQTLIDFEGEHHTEVELLDIMNKEGYKLCRILRASSDERDWYTAGWTYEGTRIYLEHMRPLEGWAIYVMRPKGTE